jgi:hypothetical protein
MYMIRRRHTSDFARLALGAALGLSLGTSSLAQSATSHTSTKPTWPDNGVAQRMFPNGSTMFVDNDHGKLRAWVLSEAAGGENVEALDFFSGQRMKVKVDLEENGKQGQSFTDAKGGFHSTVGRCQVPCDSIVQRIWRFTAARDAIAQLRKQLGTT